MANKPSPIPTIGRIVIVTAKGRKTPAIVTDVNDDGATIGCVAFHRDIPNLLRHSAALHPVTFDPEGKTDRSWSWPDKSDPSKA